jgi:hypothetical protein
MFVPGSISGYFAVLVAAALLWLAIFEVGCQFRRGNVIADSRKFALPHLDVSERGEGGPVTTGTRINWRILREPFTVPDPRRCGILTRLGCFG